MAAETAWDAGAATKGERVTKGEMSAWVLVVMGLAAAVIGVATEVALLAIAGIPVALGGFMLAIRYAR
ncbi:hypothetical protein LCGC14_3094050 [marine sediment metagenome]|uniref:Uncharacterized protein n=1 Tax=marine sediment metagenome TaxID=412755 RepID=A0A0F8Z014_9ZZZZ